MCQNCQEDQDLSSKLIGMQLMGVFFGYPVCCIQAFIQRAEKIHNAIKTGDMQQIIEASKVTPIQEGYNSGFIPCVSCAALIKPGEEGKLIQKTRVCSTPYPYDHTSDIEFDKFMEGALK